MRKPGKYSEFKAGFVAWSKETYKVEAIAYDNGMPVFTLAGRDRPLTSHEILKVNGVSQPPRRRVVGKRIPETYIRTAPMKSKLTSVSENKPSASFTKPIVAPLQKYTPSQIKLHD